MCKNSDQKFTAFLWFDDKAEVAAHVYATVFDDARVVDRVRTREEWASG
jgi:predicted 3-demethylubiquinone-9 3-methyltransferase (glyoxalase superfamily)